MPNSYMNITYLAEAGPFPLLRRNPMPFYHNNIYYFDNQCNMMLLKFNNKNERETL